MSFGYLAGVTTPGAPDPVVDWFTTFEAWMIARGWQVAAGGGTQDIYFRSNGEGPGPALTMLFVHVWRDGGFPNRIRVEVTDDIVPTHTTAEGGYLDSGGIQFGYFMSGDMDAIVLVSKMGGGYRKVYAGLVMPFALTIPDETYSMIATSTCSQGSILRDWNNVWDVDAGIYDGDNMDDNVVDPLTNELTLPGTYFNRFTMIAGQLRHVSAVINDPGPTAEDTFTTGMPGGTTEWIVMQDAAAQRFAMRTGGVLPTGVPDGNFATVAGVAGNAAALWAAVVAFAVGRGWTSHGDPGWYPAGSGLLFSSPGVSGLEDIWAGFFWENLAPGRMWSLATDDLAGTHRAVNNNQLNLADFPINYWISGDADCIALVWQIATGYNLNWIGLTTSYAPSLIAPPAQTEYSNCAMCMGWPSWDGNMVRDHQNNWGAGINVGWDGVPATNSNPNAFDGVTYQVWPMHAYDTAVGGNYPIGQFKYIGFSSGALAALDTITIGAQVHTVFFAPAGNPFPSFCLRTL